MIVQSTPAGCWNAFGRDFFGYWGRLQTAGSGRGLIAPNPALSADIRQGTASCILGGEAAYEHVAMGTPDDIADLAERCKNKALAIGTPPQAFALGAQYFTFERSDDGGFLLRQTSYKYTLLYRSDNCPNWKQCTALRLEGDDRIGHNSWLLNHPIHHLQMGDSKRLRFHSADSRSLVGFVDWALRAFGEAVWFELYPDLSLELVDEGGVFQFLTSGPGGSIRDATKEHLGKVLRSGKADRTGWFRDLELWNKDTRDWVGVAPETYTSFRDATLFDAA